MQIDFINLTLSITTFLWITSLGYLFFSFIALELFKYKKNKRVFSGNFSQPVTILIRAVLILDSRDDHCSDQRYQGGDEDTNEYRNCPRHPKG